MLGNFAADNSADGQQVYNQNRPSTTGLSSYNAPVDSRYAAYMSSYPVKPAYSAAPLPAMPPLPTSSTKLYQPPGLASTQLGKAPIAMNRRNTQGRAVAYAPATDLVANTTPAVVEKSRSSRKRALSEDSTESAITRTSPAKKRRSSR